MARRSPHSVARSFADYAVEHLLRELRDDPRALAGAMRLYGGTFADAETIVRLVFERLSVEIDSDGEVRFHLPARKRR